MESIRTNIKCPTCGLLNCNCDSNFRSGEEEIFCPDCGHYEKLLHLRDETGNFVWEIEPKDLRKNNVMVLTPALEGPFATYIIEDDSLPGNKISGVLKLQSNCDNFINFINCITSRSHKLKKVTIYKFIAGIEIEEIIFQNSN